MRYIYSNKDSSIVRVVVDYTAGDYGRGQNEFVVTHDRLIYQKDLVHDWLVVNSPQDTNNYQLRETVRYFKTDSTGIKHFRTVYTKSLEINEAEKDELKNKMVETDTLTKSEYVQQYNEFRNALQLELHDE